MTENTLWTPTQEVTKLRYDGVVEVDIGWNRLCVNFVEGNRPEGKDFIVWDGWNFQSPVLVKSVKDFAKTVYLMPRLDQREDIFNATPGTAYASAIKEMMEEKEVMNNPVYLGISEGALMAVRTMIRAEELDIDYPWDNPPGLIVFDGELLDASRGMGFLGQVAQHLGMVSYSEEQRRKYHGMMDHWWTKFDIPTAVVLTKNLPHSGSQHNLFKEIEERLSLISAENMFDEKGALNYTQCLGLAFLELQKKGVHPVNH